MTEKPPLSTMDAEKNIFPQSEDAAVLLQPPPTPKSFTHRSYGVLRALIVAFLFLLGVHLVLLNLTPPETSLQAAHPEPDPEYQSNSKRGLAEITLLQEFPTSKIPTAPGQRLLIIGDVHGMYTERTPPFRPLPTNEVVGPGGVGGLF